MLCVIVVYVPLEPLKKEQCTIRTDCLLTTITV
jgi:hypothetical protein